MLNRNYFSDFYLCSIKKNQSYYVCKKYDSYEKSLEELNNNSNNDSNIDSQIVSICKFYPTIYQQLMLRYKVNKKYDCN